MKIALVHEFLTQYGGAERVLDAFLELWPEAPIHTLYYDPKKMAEFYGNRTIRTSFIQKLWAPPPAGYKWFLPLYPRAIESFDLTDYDVILSDSSAFAKGVLTRKPSLHISYIHTPTRYLWSDEQDYLQDAPIPSLVRPILPPVWAYLKRWDLSAAQRPDAIIANSKEVASRIRRFYQRDADTIIFPPVDTRRFTPSEATDDYWLIVGRQEPYKRTDLAIQAATRLGLKLVVVGGGSHLDAWKKMAGPTVTFTGRVGDPEVAKLMSRCIGLIFPPKEDAGITPLEVMAAGRPVLAFGQGGACETVVPGTTGEFFLEQTVDGLCTALSKFRPERYDTKKIRARAEEFDISVFEQKIEEFIAQVIAKNQVS
jgi:glycosyltransferase involved in cell wall biosynthesis